MMPNHFPGRRVGRKAAVFVLVGVSSLGAGAAVAVATSTRSSDVRPFAEQTLPERVPVATPPDGRIVGYVDRGYMVGELEWPSVTDVSSGDSMQARPVNGETGDFIGYLVGGAGFVPSQQEGTVDLAKAPNETGVSPPVTVGKPDEGPPMPTPEEVREMIERSKSAQAGE